MLVSKSGEGEDEGGTLVLSLILASSNNKTF
jgi:hypothetical protein